MIKSFVGPMFSGKSDALISTYQGIWNKDLVIAFKSKKDTRDGAFIKSKKYDIQIPAVLIDRVEDIIEYVKDGDYRTVFIDEAQMLDGDVSLLVDMSVILEIDFYIGGLGLTSEQKPFGLMPEILAISDEVVNISGSCQDCSRPSIYTYYTADDKISDIQVGDTNYVSLCPRCLRKRKETAKVLKLGGNK